MGDAANGITFQLLTGGGLGVLGDSCSEVFVTNDSDVYRLRRLKHFHKTDVVQLELLARRHMTASQQFFCRGHLLIAIHARNSKHAIVFHEKSKKVVSRNVAAIDDLVPRRRVSDVNQTNIELSRPEERNCIERDVASYHIAGRRPALLLRGAPVFDPHVLPRARIGETDNVSRSKKSVGGTQPRINNNGARLVQLDPIEELRCWSHPHSNDDHVGLDLFATIKRNGFDGVITFKAIHDVAELETNTVVLVNKPEQRADLRSKRGFKRLL